MPDDSDGSLELEHWRYYSAILRHLREAGGLLVIASADARPLT